MNIQQFLNQRRMDYTPQTGEHSKKFQPVPCAAMCRIGYSVESTPQTKPVYRLKNNGDVDVTTLDKPVENIIMLILHTPLETKSYPNGSTVQEEYNLPTYQQVVEEYYNGK